MRQFIDIPIGDEFYFQWHLTERCNRACKHCYQGEMQSRELDLADLLRIVDLMEDAVDKWGLKGTLSLTGGEPLLRHDDLHNLMDRLDHSKNLLYYDILTNGSLINKMEAKAMAEHLRLRRVQVSLEGATAATNDSIRGGGSYDLTLAAIRCLVSTGIAVSVMTTISRLNQDEILAMVELSAREGVSTLAFERLIPEGAGIDLTDQVLSTDELCRLYEKIYLIATSKPGVRILLYRPLYALLTSDDPSVGALCSAGNNALTIMPDGTVYPCRRLPIPIGNVLTDGFFKIWYGSEVLWKIRDLNQLKGKCAQCDLVARCRGCRAMAYFMTGDYMAEDPQCWL